MSKQVLIINITRMGDLVQTIPLLARLNHEWPGVAIDLIVDQSFASMAALLPGLRHVHAYDFQRLTDHCRTMATDVVTLYREMSAWTRPLIETKYDRVVNLTFNRRSGLLASHIGAPDIRGVTTTSDGVSIIHNSWMILFCRHASPASCRFNRFNLVESVRLGGQWARSLCSTENVSSALVDRVGWTLPGSSESSRARADRCPNRGG